MPVGPLGGSRRDQLMPDGGALSPKHRYTLALPIPSSRAMGRCTDATRPEVAHALGVDARRSFFLQEPYSLTT